VITRCIGQVLPDSEIAFRREARPQDPNGVVAKGELYLLDRDVAFVGELCKCAPRVMGSEFDAEGLSVPGDDEVNGLRGDALSGFPSGFIHGAK